MLLKIAIQSVCAAIADIGRLLQLHASFFNIGCTQVCHTERRTVTAGNLPATLIYTSIVYNFTAVFVKTVIVAFPTTSGALCDSMTSHFP